MIATVSPGASSADHTLNTLRYTDRVKEQKVKVRDITAKKTPSRSPSQSPLRNRRSPSPPMTLQHSQPNLPYVDNEEFDDLDVLHASLQGNIQQEENAGNNTDDVAQLHRTVQSLFEEEEDLLNLHMSIIQENAELLTEEGRLLQSVQGNDIADHDVDQYASRLGNILDRKTYLITGLQEKLALFRSQVQKEEELSERVRCHPEY